MQHLKTKAKQAARTAGIGAAAMLALAIGLMFWTLAAWLFLLTQTSPLGAAAILGALYSGAGLIGVAVVLMRKEPQEQPTATPTIDSLVSAFMTGVKAGSRTR